MSFVTFNPIFYSTFSKSLQSAESKESEEQGNLRRLFGFCY